MTQTGMKPSIFLSYARDDDEPFVRRLHGDLTKAGFDVWFDRLSMPSRQLTFHREIRDAIAARDRLLLVVGPAVLTSDYVAQEWRFAYFDGDKCVNPIVRLDGTRVDGFELIPEDLKLLHAEDFRDDKSYNQHLQNLIRQLSEATPPVGKLVAVPELPAHFRAQPERIKALRDLLLGDLRKPVVVSGAAARVGLQGMGGIGKSVLASALAHHAEVRRAFGDGIFWITLGQSPNLAELQRWLAKELGDEALFTDERSGKERLRKLLAGRKALLVLDDVWQRKHAEAFNVIGPMGRVLLTTRDAGLVTALASKETHYRVEVPSKAEGEAIFAAAAQFKPDAVPSEIREIVAECGRLPLALALCGGMVRRRVPAKRVLEALREHDLEYLSDRNPAEGQHQSVWKAMDVSLRVLLPEQRDRFAELAVFGLDRGAPDVAVATLWEHTGGLSPRHADDLLADFADRSLLQLYPAVDGAGQPAARVTLHDLLHNFATGMAKKRFGLLAALHQCLIDAYRKKCSEGWPSGPNDGYFLQNLCEHLDRANSELIRFGEVLTREWLIARETHKGTLDGFESDAKALLSRARRLGPTEIGATELGLQVRAVLAASSIGSIARSLPPSFVRALVVAHLWSPEHAFTYARQATSTGLTSCVLGEIADLLTMRLLVDATNLVIQEEHSFYRSRALCGLIPALCDARLWSETSRALAAFDLQAPDLWMEQGEACLLISMHVLDGGDAESALQLIDLIRNPWSKAMALGAIAGRLTGSHTRQAVDIARKMEHDRALALLCFGASVDGETGRALLVEALTEHKLDENDLRAVLPFLPKSRWLTPEGLFAKLGNAHCTEAAAALIQRECVFHRAFETGNVEEALPYCSLHYLRWGDRAILELFDRCNSRQRDRVLGKLRADARDAGDFLILAALVDEEDAASFFQRGVSALHLEFDSAKEHLYMHRALEGHLKYFSGRRPTPGTDNPTTRALARWGVPEHRSQRDLLAVLSERFPMDFGAAMTSAIRGLATAATSSRGIRRGIEPGNLVGMLGPYLHEPHLEACLGIGLSLSSQPDWLWDVLHDQDNGREAAISGLAPYLPPRLLRLALARLRTVPIVSEETLALCGLVRDACSDGPLENWQVFALLDEDARTAALRMLCRHLDREQAETAIKVLGTLSSERRLDPAMKLLRLLDFSELSNTSQDLLVSSIVAAAPSEHRTAALITLAATAGDFRVDLWSHVGCALEDATIGYSVRSALRETAQHIPLSIAKMLLHRARVTADLDDRIELRATLLNHPALPTRDRKTAFEGLLADASQVEDHDYGQRLAIQSAMKALAAGSQPSWVPRLFEALPSAVQAALGPRGDTLSPEDSPSADAAVGHDMNLGRHDPRSDDGTKEAVLWSSAEAALRDGHRDTAVNAMLQLANRGKTKEVLAFLRNQMTSHMQVRAVGEAVLKLAPFLARPDLPVAMEIVDVLFHSHGSIFWPGNCIRAVLLRAAQIEGFNAIAGWVDRLPEWERVESYAEMLSLIVDGHLPAILREILHFRHDTDDRHPLVDGLGVVADRLAALPQNQRIALWHETASSLVGQRRVTAIRAIEKVAPLLVAIGGAVTRLRVVEQINAVLPWFAGDDRRRPA